MRILELKEVILSKRNPVISFLKYISLKFYQKPHVVISFGYGIGDDLLCTIIIRQLKNAGVKNIWVKTKYPELFKYNKDVKKVVNKLKHNKAAFYIEKYLGKIHYKYIQPIYTSHDVTTDSDRIPQKHIVKVMCDIARVEYPAIIQPYIFLTDEEKLKGNLFQNQVCIQSSGRGSKNYMFTKEWIPSRFNDVVAYLKKKYTVIQLGTVLDPLIPGVVDMRGKTSIRQSAAILSNAKFFIGLVGFLMHLARSVNCKSIIIYGGRELASQTGYDVNINIESNIFCSPCWYWNTCPNNKLCMDSIESNDVISAIKKLEKVNKSSSSYV